MNRNKKKIIRATTVPLSLSTFLNGSIETLMEKYDLVFVSSPDKELKELHKQYGVKVVGVPMERHISAAKDFKSLCKLIKVFINEKPYMIHSMTPKAGLLCMIAGWICRVPRRVHTFTGLVWPTSTGIKRKILMATDWITCACATHVIPEGEGVKNDLQNHITKKPMKVLGFGNVRGVNMEYWCLRPEIELKAEKLRQKGVFTFLFVGRLVGDKGINELIGAFCKLLNDRDDIRLVLVGPAEDELDPLEQTTWDRIKSTPSIVEIGPVWGDEILDYYAASDCFVFPSYREGFPNTPLEAGAMGLPCIVTDINGAREIISGNESRFMSHGLELSIRDNGIVIPPKNAEALYEAMKLMLTNNDLRKKMEANARPMIESRFEQCFVRKCLFDFYDEIMS